MTHDGSPERETSGPTLRAAWGTVWLLGVAVLSAISPIPLVFGLLAFYQLRADIQGVPGIVDEGEPEYASLFLFLAYVGAFLIPVLLLLNEVVARRALGGRMRWLPWVLAVAAIVAVYVVRHPW